MQDVQPRVVGDRRLRPHSHQQQAVKCPRCESLNTKFCYYNNYNLSQPRHFCKNCRRYWTKGGVLRNVPVGGGCRKTKKRSKPKPTPKPPNSLSTSDSSSAGVLHIPAEENFGIDVALEPLMEPSHHDHHHHHHHHHQIGDNDNQVMFSSSSSEIGGFANLMNHSGDPLGFVCGGMLDPTVRIDDLVENSGSDGGLVALDWQGGTGLFDLLPSSGAEYWNQTTSSHHPQWSDNATSDLPLFLP